jgi:hypothetical protein
MRDKEIKLCPFRTWTETRLSATIPGESFTKEFFMPCIKEECPAFYLVYGEYEQEYERCKRL